MRDNIDVKQWSSFHRIWDLIVNGDLPRPLCLKDEDHLMVPGISSEDDSPLLRCLTCRTKMILGSDFYEQQPAKNAGSTKGE